MTFPRQLLQIDYDQFHRYAAVTALLKPLLEGWSRGGKELRILEVGSHALHLLPAFLSPLRVEVVRADLEPAYAGEVGPYVTIKPDEPLPFEDGVFDVTVAMEVLEHIPAAARQRAIEEWARVASRGIFFTCPNGEAVAEQERRADAAFQARHGRAHPWLEEHERYGRPTQEQVWEWCQALGLSCVSFGNSPLDEWLPLLIATEQFFEQGDREFLGRFNAMLNTRPFRPFIDEPCYRRIYGCMKTDSLANQAQQLWHQVTQQAPPEEDPVQVLSTRLSQFMQEQHWREVEGARVNAHMEAVHLRGRQQQEVQDRLICDRWRDDAKGLRRNRSARTIPDHAVPSDLSMLQERCWQVQGEQPGLTWSCEYQPGWHHLAISGAGVAGEAVKLELDYGHGFGEQHVVQVGEWKTTPGNLGVHTYFHHVVRRIRLKPCQQQGPVLIEAFRIQPVSRTAVALLGLKRLLCDLVRYPKWTWQAVRKSGSLLRLGMQLTTIPEGLPVGAITGYQHRLMEQTPSRRERLGLIEEQKLNPTKLAVFWRVDAGDTRESIATTWQSLVEQDTCNWELWCAATDEQQLLLNTMYGESMPIHWLRDRPDRGLASVLNECAQVSQCDWMLQVRTGDVLVADACIQLLQTVQKKSDAVLVYAEEDVLLPFEGPARPTSKSMLTPLVFWEEPAQLGSAFALHVPTLLHLGGFHPCYEGALAAEYLYRLLRGKMPLASLDRVLLHRSPQHEQQFPASSVLDRLKEENQVGVYQIQQGRLTLSDLPSMTTIAELDAERFSMTREGASC